MLFSCIFFLLFEYECDATQFKKSCSLSLKGLKGKPSHPAGNTLQQHDLSSHLVAMTRDEGWNTDWLKNFPGSPPSPIL